MGQIWVTSDWHFCHDRDFIWRPRGFNSVYEMNKAIVERHNAVVNPDDEVYCLGDCMLNNNEEGMRLIKQLKGNLHLVRGNHDTGTRMELYNQCWNVAEICEGKYFNYSGYHFYLSHYPCLTSNLDDDKPLKARIINLCGHYHTQDPFVDFDKGLIFHCEVDTNDCKPWNINEIIEKIKEKV